MNLFETIRDLESHDDRSVIVARRPWEPSSLARVVAPGPDFGIPVGLEEVGLDYFSKLRWLSTWWKYSAAERPRPMIASGC